MEAELLYQRGLPPQVRYVFKHALVQDTAYQSLLKSTRQHYHNQIAQVLTEQFAETIETQPELVAHHYTEAGLSEGAIPYWQRAGERAVQLPAYAEAVRFYRLALQALERQEPVDERQRSALLLALGKAQWKAGEYLAAQETLLGAATVARSLGRTDLFSRAALLLSRLTEQVSQSAVPVVRLLEEALQGVGEEDSLLKAKILGGLARALGTTADQHQALVYAQQAVDMGRRFADLELLADNIQGMLHALQGPEHTQQRLVYASEMLQLADTACAKDLSIYALFWHVYCLTELGNMSAADAAIDVHARLAEEMRQPFHLWMDVGFRAMRALMQGRFADSERLAQEALAIGQRLQTDTAAGMFGL